MSYDTHKHHRRSIRLKGYDYTQEGMYFVTICVQGGLCLLGAIEDGQMILSAAGRMVEKEWRRTAELRDNVELDAFVVMPNHFHGVVCILDETGRRGMMGRRGTMGRGTSGRGTMHRAPTEGQFGRAIKGSLATIIGTFKAAVTRRVNAEKDTAGASFWQRNYYEQIIRNERHLNAIRQYIENNPAAWEDDLLHPAARENR